MVLQTEEREILSAEIEKIIIIKIVIKYQDSHRLKTRQYVAL